MPDSELDKLQALLDKFEIYPHTEIGQHFLFDRTVLDVLLQLVTADKVIEIGSGIGNLTESIAQKGHAVHGFEIDTQFKPVLEKVIQENPNVKISFADALTADFEKIVGKNNSDLEWQVVANLPYHISEPFLKKLVGLNIESAILLVGKKLAAAMMATDPGSLDYSKTSLISQTFFEVSAVQNVGSKAFYPEPRVESTIVMLTPRNKEEYRYNKLLSVLKQLVLSEKRHRAVKACIKEALDSISTGSLSKSGLGKKETNRVSRRSNRMELRQYLGDIQESKPADFSGGKDTSRVASSTEIINRLELPEYILSSPFSALDNQGAKLLVKALEKAFGM